MKREPIRHHYIPQFILRNFAVDNSGKVLYYDKKSKKTSEVKPRDIFFENNLYRDEINCVVEPTQIEHNLAVYENEISHIIKEKFLNGKEIYLDAVENDKITLFFAIMGLRAKSVKDLFAESLSIESQRMYKQYQNDGDFADFWKRNLGYAVQCRSTRDVLKHPNIDLPFKIFLKRDAEGLFGMYLVVAENREATGFIIGDCYPVVQKGVHWNGLEHHLYSIFPISPNRVILLVNLGVQGAPRKVTHLRECVLRQPINIFEKKGIKIRVKSLYPEESKYINEQVVQNAKEGFVLPPCVKVYHAGTNQL